MLWMKENQRRECGETAHAEKSNLLQILCGSVFSALNALSAFDQSGQAFKRL
jgi:hypothetical protein